MINFEPLDSAISHAVEHPEEHNQRVYLRRTPCGTTACIAGRIALQAGYTPAWEPGNRDTAWVDGGGRAHNVYMLAAQIIGIGEQRAAAMFARAANLAEVIALRNAWAAAAGLPERTWSPS